MLKALSSKSPALFALVILVLAAACAPASTSAPLTPVTVQLAWTHQAQFAGLYAADLQGYFAAEGLDVTFVEGGSNVDKFAPLLDGSAQFGIAGADELILALAEGKSLRAVATIYRRSPVVFVALKEKGINGPEDLAGQTIRAPANVTPSLHAMMTRVGIPRDQYTVVDLPTDLGRFATGEVPVWGMYSNAMLVGIQQAGYEVSEIYPDDYGVHFYADSLHATDELIETNPSLVLRFVRASLRGWTYAIENPAEVPAMVGKYLADSDPAEQEARMIASLPLVNTGEDHIGWMKPEVWAGMEKTLREQGALTRPVDVTEAYTTEFLEEIYGK